MVKKGRVTNFNVGGGGGRHAKSCILCNEIQQEYLNLRTFIEIKQGNTFT